MTIPLLVEAMLGADRLRQREVREPEGPLGEHTTAMYLLAPRQVAG